MFETTPLSFKPMPDTHIQCKRFSDESLQTQAPPWAEGRRAWEDTEGQEIPGVGVGWERLDF